jgi:hypothetical protein
MTKGVWSASVGVLGSIVAAIVTTLGTISVNHRT